MGVDFELAAVKNCQVSGGVKTREMAWRPYL